jgi:hypothetical protein
MPKRGGSRGRKKPSLQSLTREFLTRSQTEEYFDELYGASERTTALVAAAAVDQLLVQLLQTHFIAMDEADLDSIFYGQRAVLAGLSERVTIAHALGLIPTEMKPDLDVIRRVRNAFAHRVQPLSFDHPLIKEECFKLTHVGDAILRLTEDAARRRYINCSLFLAGYLAKLLETILLQQHAEKQEARRAIIIALKIRATQSLGAS